MPSPTIGYGLPVSPQARKVCPLLPQAVAEGWSAETLSDRAGIGIRTAYTYLAKITQYMAATATTATDSIRQDGLAVARRVQSAKVARLERVEKQLERLTEAVEKGEINADLLEKLVRTDDKHNQLARNLSGIELAEKAALARLKGEAMGQGFGRALIDATAGELMGEIWEAETVDFPPPDNGSEGESA